MALEFAIIKDNQVTITASQEAFARLVDDHIEASVIKLLSEKGTFQAKKLTKEEIMGITSTSVRSVLTVLERMLKVRNKP